MRRLEARRDGPRTGRGVMQMTSLADAPHSTGPRIPVKAIHEGC